MCSKKYFLLVVLFVLSSVTVDAINNGNNHNQLQNFMGGFGRGYGDGLLVDPLTARRNYNSRQSKNLAAENKVNQRKYRRMTKFLNKDQKDEVLGQVYDTLDTNGKDEFDLFRDWELLGGEEYVRVERDALGISIKGVTEQRRLLRPGTSEIGQSIYQALSGDRYGGGPINGISEGLAKGLVSRIARDFGTVLSKNVGGALGQIFGRSFGFMVDKGFRSWEHLFNDIFHDGYECFKVDSLQAWQKLVIDVFKDIEKMIKEGLKDSLRGRDMMLRPFDSPDDEEEEEEFDPARKAEEKALRELLDPWRILVMFYASIFDRLIEEIDQRKLYYDKLEIEVFYAEQIKFLLSKFRKILDLSESLGDLESKLKSNKAILTAIQRGVNNVFVRLIEKVKPVDYSSNGFSRYKSSNKKYSSSSSYYNDDDEDDSYHGFSSSYE